MIDTSASCRSSSTRDQWTLPRPSTTSAATVILLFAGCLLSCQKDQFPSSAATASPVVSESRPDDEPGTTESTRKDEENPSASTTSATPASQTTDPSSDDQGDLIIQVEENICQADLGCGEPEQVPMCTAEVASAPVASIESFDDAPVGRQIVLDGTLLGESLACTEMGCAHLWPCCNSCFGTMSIETPIGRVWLVDNSNLRYDIQGDESLSCDPFVSGIEVRAVGTVGENRYGDAALLDPIVCRR